MNDKKFQNAVELFFDNPSSKIHPKKYSPLHLLRRQIRICFSIDPENQAQAIWPGAMATLAGIELLGAYCKGDKQGKGSSFLEFCKTYLDLSPEESEIIYMLRNAFVHTHGLVARNDINSSPNKGKLYKYKVSYCEEHWLITGITSAEREVFSIVNLCELYKRFENAIEKYHKKILSDEKIAENFSKTFKFLGVIEYEE
jgi:hypothetical protein